MSENKGYIELTSQAALEKYELTGPAKMDAVRAGWKQDEQRKKEKAGE